MQKSFEKICLLCDECVCVCVRCGWCVCGFDDCSKNASQDVSSLCRNLLRSFVFCHITSECMCVSVRLCWVLRVWSFASVCVYECVWLCVRLRCR